MSHSDMKVSRHLPTASQDEASDVLDRAKDMIRALDSESRAHMEQISAEEKGSVPENSAW